MARCVHAQAHGLDVRTICGACRAARLSCLLALRLLFEPQRMSSVGATECPPGRISIISDDDEFLRVISLSLDPTEPI